MSLRFRYTILFVDDVSATIDFYTKAFGIDAKFVTPEGDYGELATGDTTLAFSSLALMRQLGKSPGQADPSSPIFEIAFETDDVAGAIATAVDQGAELVQDPREEPWGQTTAYVRDPNGYLIEICSPVANAG